MPFSVFFGTTLTFDPWHQRGRFLPTDAAPNIFSLWSQPLRILELVVMR